MIELAGVGKRYGASWVVRDVRFRISAGELVAVLGESGSGKTTLLRMINRLVEPDAGAVRIAGEDVRARDTIALRRSIGYVIYEAAARGEVDVIAAFSSDGRIAANELVVLDDPAGALPPYDAMLLLGPRVAADARVVCALADLRGAITVERMRTANLMVDRDARPVPEAAAWLASALPPVPARCATPP